MHKFVEKLQDLHGLVILFGDVSVGFCYKTLPSEADASSVFRSETLFLVSFHTMIHTFIFVYNR